MQTIVPKSIESAAALVAEAAQDRTALRIVGGGTRRTLGYEVEAGLNLSTAGLAGPIEWEPDDLTVVVEAGVAVSDLEALLRTKGQSSLLPEQPGSGTVGGVIAAGASGYRRARYGPTRDRVLEVMLVTGDGRVVRGGGRLVKNVTGYDIPRLAVGSLGTIGLIARVCLKLWPVPHASATVEVDSATTALNTAFRPQAILETEQGASVFLAGTKNEVDGQAAALGGVARPGLAWPDAPSGSTRVSVRVPPSEVAAVVVGLPAGVSFVAEHGVGVVSVGVGDRDVDWIAEARTRAEHLGGGVVVETTSGAVRDAVDPWGTPPASLDIQRRLIAHFDPQRVLNPGILPGRL